MKEKKKLLTEEPSAETCIEVLKSMKGRFYIYDTALSQYGKEYIEDLKNLETSVIDKVISILQNRE